MSRRKRVKCESAIYHIMIRGMNKQEIFHDDEDYRRFISIIREAKEKFNFELFAFCLMPNHVHFLLKEISEPLESIFKSIGIRYAYYYNTKYQRFGSLFQDRFKSLPVEDDEYFISALRYIHNNPVKAKMVEAPGEYTYSSFNDYINKSGITDTEFALSLMSEKEFVRMHIDSDLFTHLDIEMFDKIRLSNSAAEEVYKEISNGVTSEEIQKMNAIQLKHFVSQLEENNLSKRQICMFTGLSYYQIK